MSAGKKTYLITPSPESALAVDIETRGLRKQKHLFSFESYRGDLEFDPEDPTATRMRLEIDAISVCCRTPSVKAGEQTKLGDFARNEILKAREESAIDFVSTRATPKPLRGYVVEGDLRVGSVIRAIRANMVFGTPKNKRLLVEGDASVRLSELALPIPSMFMGFTKAENDALVRAVLWCTEKERN